MKVGFLFNHDALHQIAHTAPVVAAMAVRAGVETVVLSSSSAQEARVRALIGAAAGGVRFVPLGIGRAAAVADRLLGRVAPVRRVAVLRDNLDAFRALDVLVVPETTSLLLRDRFGLADLKFVWLPHGAGDRSVGFRSVSSGFDLILVAGSKVRDRMLAEGAARRDAIEVVGYPKFDTIDWAAPPPRPFANDRPTVLYNPHFDPRLSSWYRWGEAIVDWFAGQDRYNLIAAPHVMLFRRRVHASVEHRRVAWRHDQPARWSGLPNVIVDPGSDASIDMTYARAADLYLGDASSQVYEFLASPRPCVFLNPGGIEWRGDPSFAHWRLGEAVDALDDLPGALERAFRADDGQQDYRAAQEAAFAETFAARSGAGERAADAILTRFGGQARVQHD